MRSGAEDYLTKPVNPVLLNARISASLEKKRLRDQQRELISKFATKEVAEDLLTSGFSLGGQYVVRLDAAEAFCTSPAGARGLVPLPRSARDLLPQPLAPLG